MVLRCTAKLLKRSRQQPPQPAPPACDDDWYANLISVERRNCLLICHAATLFAIFIPDVGAAELRRLGAHVVPRIHQQLTAAEFTADALGVLDPDQVTIATTADRSVLGCMNDLALTCQLAARQAGSLAALDLAQLHQHLQVHLSGARDYIPAIDLVAARVAQRPPTP